MAEKFWKVVGGEDKGGILVRTGKEFDSPPTSQRLSTGALVREVMILEQDGNQRLQYQRVTGSGPELGWVTIRIKGKDLLVRAEGPPNETPKEAPDAGKAERVKKEAEKLAAEKAAREKEEAEKLAAEKSAREKAARDKEEAERLAAAKVAAARETEEAERLAAAKLAAAREKEEAAWLAAEKAAKEKQEADRLLADKAAREKNEAERLAAENIAKAAEAERLAAENAAKEKEEAERLAATQARVAAANAAAAEKSENVQKLTVVFRPGKVGLALEDEYGLVKQVFDNEQAHLGGVKAGMRICAIDDDFFTVALMREKAGGQKDYRMTLQGEFNADALRQQAPDAKAAEVAEVEAPAAEESEEANSKKLTVVFGPGKVGMELADEYGLVKQVFDNGQAHLGGIKAGMRISTIDGEFFTVALMRAKAGGQKDYTMILE